MDPTASHPSGQGSGNEAERGHACPRRRRRVPGGFDALLAPLSSRVMWDLSISGPPAGHAGVVSEERRYSASCSCQKPLDASATSAVRWGINFAGLQC